MSQQPVWGDSFVELLLKKGLFDPIWYLEEYTDIHSSGLTALEHFTRYGVFEGRSPCRELDVPSLVLNRALPREAALERYLLEGIESGWIVNPRSAPGVSEDLQAAWTGLLHGEYPFVVSGGAQHGAKLTDAATSRIRVEGEVARDIASIRVSESNRVAFTVHAHFADQWPLVDAAVTAAVSAGIDVKVSVTSVAGAQSIQRETRRLGDQVEVVHGINRGRNFGPLLVEFGAALNNYEVLGHCHLKRSAHMRSADRDQWVDGLMGFFDPKRGLFTSIADLVEDPGLGVLGHFDSRVLPYWANHWLGNNGQQVDIASEVPRGRFIEYPVGGFFWAKTKSIATILQRDWRYEDFPAELGQLDGTAQHAIERLVGVEAKRVGYTVRIDTGSGERLHSLIRRLYLDQLDPKRLVDEIAVSGSVSFDFFDTLFCRRSGNTETAKAAVGRFLQAEGILDTASFAWMRTHYESELRSEYGPGRDVTLAEVYSLLVNRARLNVAPELLARREMAAEAADLVPRSGVVRLLNLAHNVGKRTSVVSDTYYDPRFLLRILASHGARTEKLLICASSSTGLRKDRDEVDWGADVSIDRHLHFGDNVHSDIQLPTSRNVRTVHVAHPDDLHWMLTGRYPDEPGNLLEPDNWLEDRWNPCVNPDWGDSISEALKVS